MDPVEREISHCLRLYETPGWREYVDNKLTRMDAGASGLYAGIKERFEAALRAKSSAERHKPGV